MNEILKQIESHCPKCKRRASRDGVMQSSEDSKVWYVYYCKKCNSNFRIEIPEGEQGNE